MIVIPFAAVATKFLVGAIKVIGPQIGTLGLTARGGPFDIAQRAPKINLSALIGGVQEIQRRGLTPVISKDPFTGGFVVSTADQGPVLQEILQAKFIRQQLAPTAEELASDLAFRDFIIEQRRLSPRPVSALTQVSSVPFATRPTARLIGPGTVGRGDEPRPAIPTRVSRLSGPCAGPQTGFSRLTCARGGIA